MRQKQEVAVTVSYRHTVTLTLTERQQAMTCIHEQVAHLVRIATLQRVEVHCDYSQKQRQFGMTMQLVTAHGDAMRAEAAAATIAACAGVCQAELARQLRDHKERVIGQKRRGGKAMEADQDVTD